jgi:dephospho-CoA kinase
MDRMKTIGLVGGVASGKSVVAQLFVELGAGLLDADRMGHEVLATDEEVHAALIDRWGSRIDRPDGTIDRSVIATNVFGDTPAATAEREFLQSVLHPRIQAALDAKKHAFAAAGCPAVVLDAPLLLEAGWAPQCDSIVMVDSPRETRLARTRQRGWTEAEFARREASQWPVEKKRAAAAITLSNNGSVEELRPAVKAIWDQFVAP